jgi:hypothetical protein
MNRINKTVKELESIIAEGLQELPIPYQKGNSIRIGHMVVRKNKFGYLVIDIKNKRQIAVTNFKTSAVAIAKTFPNNPDAKQKIMKLDDNITKHYNDAMFYKHTINSTNDFIKREAVRSRFDLSLIHTEQYKKELDSYIFRKDK